MLGRHAALEIVYRAMELTQADQVQVSLVTSEDALTRFAHSAIHQNVAERDAVLGIRAVIGKRVGYVAGNATDSEGIRRCGNAPGRGAGQEENPGFVSLPGPTQVPALDIWHEHGELHARRPCAGRALGGRGGRCVGCQCQRSLHLGARACRRELPGGGSLLREHGSDALHGDERSRAVPGMQAPSQDVGGIDPSAVAHEAAMVCAERLSRDLAPGVYP